MRTILVCGFAVLVLLAINAIAAEDGGDGTPVAKKKPRTLYQACRSELTRICKGEKFMMKCLLGNQTSVTDEVCTKWLDARRKCEKDVESCKEALRVCVARADVASLSEECSSSDFYKSLKRASSLRKHKKLGSKEKEVKDKTGDKLSSGEN